MDTQPTTQLATLANASIDGPYARNLQIYQSDGLIWATLEQWVAILRAPYFMNDFLKRRVPLEAASMGINSGIYRNITVYRWPPIAAALNTWYTAHMIARSERKLALLATNERAESMRFASEVRQLQMWGWILQEKEIQKATIQRSAISQVKDGDTPMHNALAALQKVTQEATDELVDHAEHLDAHDQDIWRLKKLNPIGRDADGWVTVKQRLGELSLSYVHCIEGDQNLAQLCGQYLKSRHKARGGTVNERTDNSKQTIRVGLWYRKDVDEAVKNILSDFPPGQYELFDDFDEH